MLDVIEKYLRKSVAAILSVKIGSIADRYPVLLIISNKLELVETMHQDSYVLKLKLAHIEDTEDQIAFLKRSQAIYQALKVISTYEPQALGVLNLSSCFKKHDDTFINEFEYDVLLY